MPLYEYKCAKCAHQFEKIEKHNAPTTQKCPKCGGKAERMISAAGIQFKGSGWYVTDYKGKNSGATSVEGSGDSASAKSGDSSGELQVRRRKNRRTRNRATPKPANRNPAAQAPATPNRPARKAARRKRSDLLELKRLQVFSEVVAELRILQREFHCRFQEAQLVSRRRMFFPRCTCAQSPSFAARARRPSVS